MHLATVAKREMRTATLGVLSTLPSSRRTRNEEKRKERIKISSATWQSNPLLGERNTKTKGGDTMSEEMKEKIKELCEKVGNLDSEQQRDISMIAFGMELQKGRDEEKNDAD